MQRVYFIHDPVSGLVKIGRSLDPWARMRHLQTGSAGELKMLAALGGDEMIEAELHDQFHALRVRGEWFSFTGALAAFVATLPPAITPVRFSKTAEFWNGNSAATVARKTGLAKSFLSEVQSGKRRPSPEIAVQLQRATGVSAIKLVFGDLADEAA